MRKITAVLIVVSFIFSCTKKEDPIEKEKKQMKEFFDNSKTLVVYKGVKIALRADYSDESALSSKRGSKGLKTLSGIADVLTKDTVSFSLSNIYNVYQLIKSLDELKKEINTVEEDSLPTIFSKLMLLEQQFSHSGQFSRSVEKALGTYHNGTEHFILGCIWFITPSAPADIYAYEVMHIDHETIKKSDHYLFSCLLKSLVCCENKWNYTAEQNATTYVNYITEHKKQVIESTYYLDSIPGADPEKRFYELRSFGYALRGYAKEKSDRETEANKDYDLFVEDFDKADIRNKELCFLASYLCIKNSKNDKAQKFLQKIEQSESYNEHDKHMVKELRAFIKEKGNSKFNKYMDHFSLSKIAFRYLYGISTHSEMAKQLQSNVYTKKLVEMPGKVNSAIHYSEMVLNKDSLVSSAGKLINKLFK